MITPDSYKQHARIPNISRRVSRAREQGADGLPSWNAFFRPPGHPTQFDTTSTPHPPPGGRAPKRHCVSIGDAENDHSLLEVCEIGVAVANAIDGLRAHADVTLALPDGQRVADLLRGPLLAGRTHLHPRRWQITLGIDDRGEAVTLPASQLNVAGAAAAPGRASPT